MRTTRHLFIVNGNIFLQPVSCSTVIWYLRGYDAIFFLSFSRSPEHFERLWKKHINTVSLQESPALTCG